MNEKNRLKKGEFFLCSSSQPFGSLKKEVYEKELQKNDFISAAIVIISVSSIYAFLNSYFMPRFLALLTVMLYQPFLLMYGMIWDRRYLPVFSIVQIISAPLFISSIAFGIIWRNPLLISLGKMSIIGTVIILLLSSLLIFIGKTIYDIDESKKIHLKISIFVCCAILIALALIGCNCF